MEGRSQKIYERTFLGEGRYDKGVLSFLLQAQKYPMVSAIFQDYERTDHPSGKTVYGMEKYERE